MAGGGVSSGAREHGHATAGRNGQPESSPSCQGTTTESTEAPTGRVETFGARSSQKTERSSSGPGEQTV